MLRFFLPSYFSRHGFNILDQNLCFGNLKEAQNYKTDNLYINSKKIYRKNENLLE